MSKHICVARIHNNPNQKHCGEPATEQHGGFWCCAAHVPVERAPAVSVADEAREVQLAFELADRESLLFLRNFNLRGEWIDTSDRCPQSGKATDIEKVVRYLTLRGLLITHPEDPKLVRLKD